MVIMVKNGAGGTRAFIAIEIDEAVKEKLAEVSNRIKYACAKAVPPHQVHITMAFLGGIDDESIEEIGMLLSAMRRSQFNISLTGLGVFSAKSPKVIFAKVLGGQEELGLMASYINDGIRALGMKIDERKFSAHVTIARVRGPGAADMDHISRFVAAHSGDQFGSFVCGGIKLKGSLLTPNGPVYRDLFAKGFSP